MDVLSNSTLIGIAAFIIPFIIFLWRFVGNTKQKNKFSMVEFEKELKKFNPQSLVKDKMEEISVLKKKCSTSIMVPDENKELIDLGRINYLNLLKNNEIKENATECINEYGIGTNGPRGFFGTTEIHLNLEKTLSEFLGTEDALVYAYGFTTVSSVIMTYCKPNDLIFCDEQVNFSIKQGVIMAKCEAEYFKHNDSEDLCLKIKRNEKRNKKMFLVIEGLYALTGTICSLPDILKVAKDYKLNVFLDESFSFGVLGINGKGILEHYKINVNEVDLIIGSLENCLGSIGGFCAGTHQVIEYQRLFSASYVYSASLPAFLNQAAIDALPFVVNNSIFLQILATKFQEFLHSIQNFYVLSDAISPVKIVNFQKDGRRKVTEEAIYEYCRDRGVYFILNTRGLIIHLNVELYFDCNKLNRVFRVLKSAAEVCGSTC